ncbi:MAG TPA: stress response translation initiation inhibitor YciH [Candidatus Syntrophoarchaeum butanivorans]|uniref:Protein translation factor SUI1 homolog n=1 Tax=Candidatus Syntropharchaeum butanivorans TaxID=1839936 RepID=A0A1F2P467_9EURY|nr:MAG: translation initiation factor SUI1 [Candidatus Syntrophoarchaeum butanivorans]RJS71411.1 MAG: stress response translation initiation inhibitor YciH [Candidatus Syntrophoarchaeum sp. WYZ-LMO15]HDM35917.1 stress response translation initiation inhibitor YciH [Candidatus Syntrophoarchaeum butanivorans]HEC57243.1 stress response translation initiation inhibitor YciH [Candidatus Syntrophoarchaeum butanivorans]
MPVCEKCGLPQDLCVCEEILKETQRVKVSKTKRRFNKWMTIIEGIDERDIDLKNLSRELKAECACGGTVKKGRIELQGDQQERVKEYLERKGYTIELREI